MGLAGKWGEDSVEIYNDRLADRCKRHMGSKAHQLNSKASGQALGVAAGTTTNVADKIWAKSTAQVKAHVGYIVELCRIA
ncbi:hypothetical protein FOZ63_009175, partial [Perkinsus olseni]